jgi:glutaredoxin 3
VRGIPLAPFQTIHRRKNPMSKTTATFYHAGCPVCLDAESAVTRYLDTTKVNLEVVHLGTAKNRVAEAEAAGVKSVPALVVGGQTLHLNFGAPMSALK